MTADGGLSVRQAAWAAHHAGLNVVPPREDGSKAPLGQWQQFQTRKSTDDELSSWYGPHTGLGLVCGSISGNLELFEFDDEPTYRDFKEVALAAGLGDLVQRLESGYLESTPGVGFHWFYKCDEISGNTKLARRPKTPGEMQHPKDNVKVLIETRGNGGYAIVAPSNGRVHPSGRPYVLLGGAFSTIATMTPEERQALWELARTFDQMLPSHKAPASSPGGRPWDDFNARGEWGSILEPHGWTLVYERGGIAYWRRPGKDWGVSATTNYQDSNLLYVFSTSTPFASEKGYRKFTAYTLLNHGGDFRAAAKALAGMGYGEPIADGHRLNQVIPGAEGSPWSGTSAPDDSDEQARAKANEQLDDLAAKLKLDLGFAFNPNTLAALLVLEQQDRQGFARAWETLRKAKVSLKELRRDLAKLQQSNREGSAREVPAETADRTAGFMLHGDCPAPDLIIPQPFFVTPTSTGFVQTSVDKATGKEAEERVEFAYSPILITGKLLDADEGDSYFRLGWRRPSGWRHHTAGRAVALDSHKQVELAAYDFPTASDNAKRVVSYLHSLEACNLGRMPTARISSHLGWQGKGGKDGFLWGQALLLPDGKTRIAIDVEDLSSWRAEAITFRGKTPGDEQIAGGYHAAGTLENWLKAISVIQSYPKALVIFYSSFVPPLQIVLGAPNFTIETFGRTSTGKTTCLKTAASTWGNPDERSGDGAMWTWDVTRVFLERCSAIISGMPLIMDDTKRVKDPKMVSDLLYTLESGRGRGRGNTKSLAQTGTWKTVLISSGEAPAYSYTSTGGAKTRVLGVRGLPFHGDGEATRLLVDRLGFQVQSNYGHGGPGFVQWLIQNRSHWLEYRAEYLKQVSHYATKTDGTGPEAGRLAQYVAAIDVAGALAHAALGLPWTYRNPLADGLWEAIADEATDAAGEIRALRDVVSWANANQEAFIGRHRTDSNGQLIPPGGGMAGRWDSGEDWGFIGFHKHVLDRILREMGYEAEGILGHWRERGWLDIGGDRKRFEKNVRLRGEQARLVIIPHRVLTDVAG